MALLMVLRKRKKRCWIRWRDTLITQSEVFQAEYADWSVILRVTFDEEPDQLILALLNKCYPWADDYAVKLEFEIGGKQVRFVEQS